MRSWSSNERRDEKLSRHPEEIPNLENLPRWIVSSVHDSDDVLIIVLPYSHFRE